MSASDRAAGTGSRTAAKESLDGQSSSSGATVLAAAPQSDASPTGPWLRVESALHLSVGQHLDRQGSNVNASSSGTAGLVVVAAEGGGWSFRTPVAAATPGSRPGTVGAVWNHDARLPAQSEPEILAVQVRQHS